MCLVKINIMVVLGCCCGLSFLLSSTNADKKVCYKKCGGAAAFNQSLIKEEVQCEDDDDGSGRMSIMTPCILDCLGRKPAENQLECFCWFCKGKGFCEKPGTPEIKEDECQELACAGKAKYFGPLCASGNDG